MTKIFGVKRVLSGLRKSTLWSDSLANEQISVSLTALLFTIWSAAGAEIDWTAEANMDHQLFPSLIIATASQRPVEEEDAEVRR